MSSKNIVLLDYTLIGHHLSFLRSFSKILLEQGHCVYCIAPEIEKISGWVDEHCEAHKHSFYALEYKHRPKKYRHFGRFNHTASVLEKWRYDAKLLRGIEKEKNIKIDLVFYAWLDTQLAAYLVPPLLDSIFPYKWSGLYFHPHTLRLEPKFLNRKANWRDTDALFLSKNCVAVAIHDQGIREGFENRIGKPVIHFPETADATAPDYNYPLYKELIAKAGGRKIVGMIGCESHKGTITFMRTAKLADPKEYYFVFLGTLPQNTYSENDWRELQTFIEERRENCFFKFEPIPEGGAYNAIFYAFDIPFLVYDNFISSSNRLTKAAIFKRLVLASNNYCVGEDVVRYNLGEAVPSKNPQTALEGLERLKNRINRKDYPYELWKIYQELNSDEKLFEQFKEIINHIKN